MQSKEFLRELQLASNSMITPSVNTASKALANLKTELIQEK